MKECPICKTPTYDDMGVCYGCLHVFDDGGLDAKGTTARLRPLSPDNRKGKVAVCAPGISNAEAFNLTVDLDAAGWRPVVINDAETARSEVRAAPDVEEAWVVSYENWDHVNLAAALKADDAGLPVRIIGPGPTGSLRCRAHAAGIDQVLDVSESPCARQVVYGKAPVEHTLDFWQADDAGEIAWSCYQFEYEDDDEPVFSAFVEKRDDGLWETSIPRSHWAEGVERPLFADRDEAMEWCSSWAWCPEAGQGGREYPDALITGQERYDLGQLAKNRRMYKESGRPQAEWLVQMVEEKIADIVERILAESAHEAA